MPKRLAKASRDTILVIVDSGFGTKTKGSAHVAQNHVKVVLFDKGVDGGEERHITVTHEGIVIDLIENDEVAATVSYEHGDLLEAPWCR